LVVLLAMCVVNRLHTVPEDISKRVAGALEHSGLRVPEIRVHGRDVSVSGTLDASHAARVLAIVKSVRGVRSVRADLTHSSAPPGRVHAGTDGWVRPTGEMR
jgi:hypothetical protein